MENTTDTETALSIDAPLSLLPNLSEWGIEEVEKGTCVDSAENRRIIREFAARYLPVYDNSGRITPYIQVITSEMRTHALAQNKSAILSDDRNIDSDWLTGVALLVEPASDLLVPAWVIAATNHWLVVQEERQKRGNPNFRPAIKSAPGRCTAKRIDKHRCENWFNGTADYGTFCRVHQSNRQYGEDEQAGHLARARNRIQSAASSAVEELEDLLSNATSEPVRLGAARELLDRAGIRGGVEIDTNVTVMLPAAELLKNRLDQLKQGHTDRAEIESRMMGHSTEDEDVVDAEVVEEEPVIVEVKKNKDKDKDK